MLRVPAKLRPRETGAAIGLVVAATLVVVAAALPPLSGWDVHPLTHGGVAPLAANWHPRVGWGTVPALVLGAAVFRWGASVASRLPFPHLLGVSYATALAWLAALAAVDGQSGIGGILGDEYLKAARRVSDVGATLRHFLEHVPLDSPHNWPTHVAGHPPGALLFFVALVRLHLGGGLAAGCVVMLVAATTPVAVALTLRRLGAEASARRALPFLVAGPAAVWSAVSADSVFAAAGAWAIAALAGAATLRSPALGALTGGAAGALFGGCVLLSYGLPLLALVGAAVLISARSVRPVPWALAGAAGVVLAFASAGFRWWTALPVVHHRYYAGIASSRPAAYWAWADLAALCISAGPVLPAAVGALAGRMRAAHTRDVLVPATVTGGALVAVALADLSLMSKAEVERIWLPFVPWLLVGAAVLPTRWRRWALAAQVMSALAVQTLLHTRW